MSRGIQIKTPAEVEQMKDAGRIAARALRVTCEAARPGITTKELDELAEETIRGEGAVPTFLGYGGFKGCICASINEEIVHGIPSPRMKLYAGDLLTIDVGATCNDWVGDNANSVGIGGALDADGQRLIDVTRQALYAGIAHAVPGGHFGDVSAAVGAVAEAAGLGIVREYTGHGVGHVMHEDPSVPNYGTPGTGARLEVGMVFAIEPMFMLGGERVKVRHDGWCVVTVDGSRAAQVEHTIAVTADGPMILTCEDEGERWPAHI
ncbi:MAG: type I methionyl aminopeptidase [Coriobacteriia bacterium]|nr:type I methionyl aminopeptidase [Coriobacteriia bacterium]